MIDVYAYWHDLLDDEYSRNGTLIVSGGCNTIIGNAILKNPGSARPLENDTPTQERHEGRYKFNPDATMYALADLFDLHRRPGTIRLFNLFDFVDTDPVRGRVLGLPTQDDILSAVTKDNLPTYLGWGQEWKWPVFKEQCTDIFNAILPFSPYLHPEMSKNKFTHPLYLMRYGRNRHGCQKLISQFRKLL